MSEKRLRFTMESDKLYSCIFDNGKELTCFELVDLLNEQQSTIQSLKEECGARENDLRECRARKRIMAEKLKQYQTIAKRFDCASSQKVENLILSLQDLCGKSDYENAKLREEVNLLKPTNIEQYEQIQKLQEENEQLRKELNDCEKFRYTVFKRLNDEHIKECSIK